MENRGSIRTAVKACGVLLLALATARSAPVEQAWEQSYNGGYNDVIQTAALDGSGNLYVLGYSVTASNGPGLLTIKYSPAGTVLWQRFYEGGLPTAIAVNALGEVWLTGLGQTTNSASYLTIKYDANGTQLWARRLSGFSQWGTEPRGFAVDSSGNAFVTGFRRIADGVDTISTVKYSPNGDELWVRVGDNMQWVSGLAADSDGNAIVTGTGRDWNAGRSDIMTVKYDPAGAVLWTAHYDEQAEDHFQTSSYMFVDSAANIYIVGVAGSPSTGANRILTVKYSPQGTLLRTTSYQDANSRWLGSGVGKLDADGNLYVTGSSIYVTSNGWAYDFITLKYEPDGTQAWSARYSGKTYELTGRGGPLALDSSGNAYVVDPNAFVVVKYAPNGNLRWAVSRPSGFARAIAADGSDSVYAAGSYPPASPQSPIDYGDFDTVKYTQSDVPSQPSAFVYPVEQEGIAGSNVVFSASVIGPGPFTYQWQFNGRAIRDETNSNLNGIQATNVGGYSVIVSNAAGYTISPEARLTKVHIPAIITSVSQTNKLAVGENKTWTVAAIGDSPVGLQWQFNGEPIPNATNALLELTNVQENASGLYSVVASNAYGMAVSAPYQLTVFRSPLTLSLKGSWVAQPNTNGFAEAVRVVGHYAYLANGRAGLEIIDVSDPSAPVRVANYRTGGFMQDVEVSGNYAYVADFYTGLHILDVHDPAHPVLAGRYDAASDNGFTDTPHILQVVGTLLYLVDADGALEVVDVSNVANPVHLATRSLVGYIHGLRVTDNKAFVAGTYHQPGLTEDDDGEDLGFLAIFDLNQPTNPVPIDFSFTGCAPAYGVDVANGYAYIAGSCALAVANVSTGTNSTVVGKFDPSYGYGQAVQLRGDYGFLAGEFLGLAVVDVSDPTDPAQVARVPMGTGQDEGWDVHVVGNHAYVARGDLGLLIFQIDETRYFSSATRTGNKLTLRWNGTRGVKLQHSPSLTNPFWEDVSGSDGLSVMELPIGSGNEFFRLNRE